MHVRTWLPLLVLALLSFGLAGCPDSASIKCPAGGSVDIQNGVGEPITLTLTDYQGTSSTQTVQAGQSFIGPELTGLVKVGAVGEFSQTAFLNNSYLVQCNAATQVVVQSKYAASHPAAPLVQTQGGPVLEQPQWTGIFFPNDTYASYLTQFLNQFGASPFWNAEVSEYGVGAGTANLPIQLTETAAAQLTDAQVQSWLTSKLTGANPQFGNPDENTVYVIYYPDTTTVTLDQAKSCQQFYGYHSNFIISGTNTNIAYAVIARCDDDPNNTGIAMRDRLTEVTSHEIAESSTDPYPTTELAYSGVDSSNSIWASVLDGEVADLCSEFPDSLFTPVGFEFMIQRIWSNNAASLSHDPCQPSLPGEVYFNTVPVLNDLVSYQDESGATHSSQGVIIPVGGSATIQLDLFSDGPTTGPWTVYAQDMSNQNAYLNFTMTQVQGQNGDPLQMTIQVVAQDPDYQAEPFWIYSTLGQTSHYWLGLVGQTSASTGGAAGSSATAAGTELQPSAPPPRARMMPIKKPTIKPIAIPRPF